MAEADTQPTMDGGTSQPTDRTLDALYNINKHARRYADLGTENYRKGKKTTAKANSNKKKALYAVKEHVLAALLDTTTRIEQHTIDGSSFWCCYFEDSAGEEWSFHSPTDCLAVSDDRISAERTLPDFAKTGEKERSKESLKASLLHLESVFGVNANDHLPDQYLWYGNNRHFIGWTYLGEDD